MNTLSVRSIYMPLKMITLVVEGLREFPNLLLLSIELNDEIPVVNVVLCEFLDLVLPVIPEISVPVIKFFSPMIKHYVK